MFKTKTSSERNEKTIDVDNKKLLHAIFLAAKITTDENAKLGDLLNLNIPKINTIFKTQVLGKPVNDPEEYLKYFSIFSVINREQFVEAKTLFNDFYGHFHNSSFKSNFENLFKKLGTEYRNTALPPSRFLGLLGNRERPRLPGLEQLLQVAEGPMQGPQGPQGLAQEQGRPTISLASVNQPVHQMGLQQAQTINAIEKTENQIAEIKQEQIIKAVSMENKLIEKIEESNEILDLQKEKINEDIEKTQRKIQSAIFYEQRKAFEDRQEFKKLFKTTKDFENAKKNLYKNAVNVALGKPATIPIFSESPKEYRNTVIRKKNKHYSESPFGG